MGYICHSSLQQATKNNHIVRPECQSRLAQNRTGCIHPYTKSLAPQLLRDGLKYRGFLPGRDNANVDVYLLFYLQTRVGLRRTDAYNVQRGDRRKERRHGN